MKEFKLIKLLLVISFCLYITPANSQNKIVATIKSYEICTLVNNVDTNCKTIKGSSAINKIEIEPNKSITIHMNDTAYTQVWDPSLLRINKNNLFIYKLMDGDPNQPDGLSVNVLMNQDYTLYCIATYRNENGYIISTVAYDR